MKILSRLDIMVKLKEKIHDARQSRDNQLVLRLEKLLYEVMNTQSVTAI